MQRTLSQFLFEKMWKYQGWCQSVLGVLGWIFFITSFSMKVCEQRFTCHLGAFLPAFSLCQTSQDFQLSVLHNELPALHETEVSSSHMSFLCPALLAVTIDNFGFTPLGTQLTQGNQRLDFLVLSLKNLAQSRLWQWKHTLHRDSSSWLMDHFWPRVAPSWIFPRDRALRKCTQMQRCHSNT